MTDLSNPQTSISPPHGTRTGAVSLESAMRTDPAASTVAVVIPVYHAGFLGEALRSVFEQSRQPDDVLVVDDGSPDQDAVMNAIAPFRDRVKVIRQSNQGAAAARNRGIEATSAEYVALLDADDVWFPSFLEDQLALLASRPDLDMVYSDGVVMGRTGLAGQRFMKSCPSHGEVTLESLLAQDCTVLLSAVVARRQALVEAGLFDLAIRRGQDFDLWLRMVRRGSHVTYQRKALVVRRVHDDNLSGTALNEQERPLRVLEKTLRTMPLSPREREVAERRVRYLRGTLAREYGKELLRQRDFPGARREFARACRGSFSWKLHAALVGLHVAPQLLRRLYLLRSTYSGLKLRPVP